MNTAIRVTPARVYLHPAAATSPQAIAAVERATGRLAFPDLPYPRIRLLELVDAARCLHQAGGAA